MQYVGIVIRNTYIQIQFGGVVQIKREKTNERKFARCNARITR